MATAKAVAAGNSCRQEDVIATANLSRRAIADMLRACKVRTLIVKRNPRWYGCFGAGHGRGERQGLGSPGALWDPNANSLGQEAAYHPEVAPDVRLRALHYGRECANGYLELLDHVLLVRKAGVVCSLYQPP